MRLVLTFGFVAAVSATAGAQLGESGWTPPPMFARPTAIWLDSSPSVAPQSEDTPSHRRHERRAEMAVTENPYVRPGDSMLRFEMNALGEPGMVDRDAAIRLGIFRPHVALNPYYVTSLDDPRDRLIEDGRPVVLESNPYLY